MSKKKIIIGGVLVVVLILGGGYWWTLSQDISLSDIGRKITGKEKVLPIDDPSQLFLVVPPEHFNDVQKERLGDKINLSRTLYDTKKEETWTWITIGNMYEFAEDYDRAISAYAHVEELNPLEYISQINIAYIYENYKKDYKKAEEYYKKVLEMNPNSPDNYSNLARLYDLKMDRAEDAERVYLEGLTKTKNYPDLLVMLIRFYQKHANAEKVAEYSKLLLRLHPDNEVYRRDFEEFAQ